jgi:PEP-CTERM motif
MTMSTFNYFRSQSINRIFLIIVLFLLMVFSPIAASADMFTFNYASWNTVGHGTLYGTINQNGDYALTGGFIEDSKFGSYKLAEGYSYNNYLVGPKGKFHYNNILHTGDDEPLVDIYGLLFVDGKKRQLNIWGFDFSLWGYDLPNYSMTVVDKGRYVWSSFIDLDMTNTAAVAAAPVPEPSTFMLFMFGILGLTGLKRTFSGGTRVQTMLGPGMHKGY